MLAAITSSAVPQVAADRLDLAASRIDHHIRQRRRRVPHNRARSALPSIKSRCTPENPSDIDTKEDPPCPRPSKRHPDEEMVQSTVQWGGATPKSGGRMLDGRTWDEMPDTTTVLT
jgi:hypothetical protein